MVPFGSCFKIPMMQPEYETCETNITDKLNKIQRKGLAICLNVTPTSSVETLEVVSGILPIHLRREEIATRVDVNGIEAEFQFNGIQRYKSPPDYWKNLGNSKSRSTDQKNVGKHIIMEKLSHLPANSCIAFTDGSCLGSPGPVGAGAVIFPSNNQPQIEISKAVSKKGSILLGELIAIKLVVDHFLISENRQNTDSITLFSDSQTSIGILTLNWKSENYIKVIREIKKNMKVLKMNGIPLNFEWTPGHADIQGNDIADSLAKKGAKEAEKIEEPSEVTRQDIKRAARESVLRKWQNQWESSQRGRNYYNYHQKSVRKYQKIYHPNGRFQLLLV
ncbi:RNASEH1 [Mytilus edulis]|uniref:RnhA n=1 Tax=Mytilus edulis TaxID=6550 RepID=A0A8S3RWM4_MYTED|nr:RNASEH1 [Mytilus edulis]